LAPLLRSLARMQHVPDLLGLAMGIVVIHENEWHRHIAILDHLMMMTIMMMVMMMMMMMIILMMTIIIMIIIIKIRIVMKL
jgi:hypothetical protein